VKIHQWAGGVMGLSLRNVMIIQSRGSDVRSEVYSRNQQTGKVAGAINLYNDEFFHCCLVSTPEMFDSDGEAINKMNEIIEWAKTIDLEAEARAIADRC